MPKLDELPYWVSKSGNAVLWLGHVLHVLQRMPSGSVQCAVTSPPYWGLRDYGTASWLGGIEDCDHMQTVQAQPRLRNSVHSVRGGAVKVQSVDPVPYRDFCRKCGATRTDDQLGAERTPEEYVA